MRHYIGVIVCCLTMVSLTACHTKAEDTHAHVQLAQGVQPVKGAIEGVEIAGYCPVAYVEANKPVLGKQAYPVTYKGKTYWFIDRGAQAAYKNNPERYRIAYQGWSATELASGERVTSDPTLFVVHNGVVYLFASTSSRDAFLADSEAIVRKASEHWDTIK